MELSRAYVVVPSLESLEVMMRGEVDVRLKYLDMHHSRSFARPIHTPSRQFDVGALVDKAATLLEFGVFTAAVAEAIRERGHKTVGAFLADLDETMPLAGRIARRDLKELGPRLVALMPAPPRPVNPDESVESIVEDVARALGPMVVSCPVEDFEKTAEAIERPELGYRCRTAVEWVHAFLFRHSDPARRRANIIGRGYADGRLTLRDAAELLGLSTTDAIALLEESGFCRDAETIRLDDSTRAAILQNIRKRRPGDEVSTRADDRVVYREVVASERIEGVDARSWLARR